MRYLDNQFEDTVISGRCLRGREWSPPRPLTSPPLDFCLWGFLKSKVYSPQPSILNQLHANISGEVAQIEPVMMRRAMLDRRARPVKLIEKKSSDQ